MIGQDNSRRKSANRVLRSAGYRVGGGLGKGDDAEDKAMIRKAIGEHDTQLHPGKHTRLSFAEGGMVYGGASRDRGDRAPRGKGAKNHIAIIVAPQGNGAGSGPPATQPPPPRPPVPPPAAAPPPMPPPGAAGPPGIGGGMPMPPGGMPPRPGMPPMMRKAGGRTRLQIGGIPEGMSPGSMMSSLPTGGERPMAGPPPPTAGAAGIPEGISPQQAMSMGMSPQQAGMQPPMKRGGRANSAMSTASKLHGPEPSDDPRKIETAAAQLDEFRPGERGGGRASRAAGGQVGPGRAKMTAGAGSGEGRLEKSDDLDYCAGGRS